MGLSIVRNRLKRLKELFYRSDGSLESYLRKGFRLSVRFCPNSPFAPDPPQFLALPSFLPNPGSSEDSGNTTAHSTR